MPLLAPAPGRGRTLLLVLAATALCAGLLHTLVGSYFSVHVVARAHNDEVAAPALAHKLLLVVVDGLRHDSALASADLPIARELAARGASGVAVASEPTMTGAGVRTLGTGVPPELMDVFRNSDMPAVHFDHLLAALRSRGHVVAVIGDHTWTDLFGDAVAESFTTNRLSMVQRHLDPIHLPDREFVREAVRVLHQGKATVLVVHLIGVDYASHSWGPKSSRFRERLHELDAQLRTILASVGPEWLVVLTSDHGATDRGHHGSGEPVARDSPLVLAGPGVALVHDLAARHIDVAPTLAALMGVPAPAPAEGRVLIEAIAADAPTRARLALGNAHRLERYLDAYRADLDGDVTRDAPSLRAAEAALVAADPAAASVHAERYARAAHEALETSRGRRTLGPGLWIPLLLAAVIVPLLARRRLRVGDWRTPVVTLLVLAAWEVALVVWRLHAGPLGREIGRAFQSHGFTADGEMLAGVGLALLVGAGLWSALAARATSSWVAFGVVAGLSGLAGQSALSAALAGLLLAGAGLRARPWLSVLVLAGLAAVLVGATTRLQALGLMQAWPPALLGGAALAAAAFVDIGKARSSGAATLLLILAGAALSVAGVPWLPFRLLVAAAALVVGVAMVRARGAPLGRVVAAWACVAVLAAMSQPLQLVGIAGVALAALALARLPLLAEDRPEAALLAGLLMVAVRYAFFAVIEGRFSLSNMDWGVSVDGNPDSTMVVGAAIVFAKFVLPFVIAVGLVGARLPAPALHGAIAWCVAFLLMRLVHLDASLTLTRGQYYTPFNDMAEILYTLGFMGSLPLAALLAPGTSKQAGLTAPS